MDVKRNRSSVLTALILGFVSVLAGIGIHVAVAQGGSGAVDVSGIWRWQSSSGAIQNKYHIEFTQHGSQLVATWFNDDPALKQDYGDSEPFFEATLDGRRFNGRMTFSRSEGALVSGKVSADGKTVEFIDGSKQTGGILHRQ